MVRLHADALTVIDAWAARQEGRPSRPQAIRRLVEIGLAATPTPTRRNPNAPKAAHMAGKEIDRLADPDATEEQQASRKRRLLKGPEEFRELRRDHPKAK